MDKRKVILAYRRGIISLKECAQILGVDSMNIMNLVKEPKKEDIKTSFRKKRVNS